MRIIYVDIDTLRPDHMGCYGYARNTTPNMDKVAAEGVRFDNVYCSDAPCLPSRAALITGMFGIKNGAVGHGGTAGDKRLTGRERDFSDVTDNHNFNRVFRNAGMRTVSISTFAERHSSWWYQAGFNETYNVGGRGGESAEQVLPVALDWLKRNAENDNWYLHLHLWDPHTPYRAPASFGDPFENEPVPTFLTPELFAEHQNIASPHGAREIGMYTDKENPAFPRHPGSIRVYDELRRMVDGYDCGVAYADWAVGEVFNQLRALGVYDDTCIIITSDHGENLGELGLYAEHATADEPTCHIPLIIKWRGVKGGRADADFHYLLDLAPTLADMLGTPKWDKWDGVSFAGALKGEGGDARRESLVLSQMAHVCQRAARFGDWLYIRTIHDGYHLFDKEMLFNVRLDPHEVNDVKQDHPDICARGAKLILDWQEQMLLESDYAEDPMWTVMKQGGPYHARNMQAPYAKRLRATGREAAAQALENKNYHVK